MKQVIWLAAVASVAACSSPKLALRRGPELPAFTRTPPEAPKPEARRSDPFKTLAQAFAARQPPDLRNVRLAVSVAAPGTDRGPSWGALARALVPAAPEVIEAAIPPSEVSRKLALVDMLLPELLIDRGYTKVVYPSALRSVLARLDRSGPRKDTATLVGSLQNLAELGGVVPADYLLSMEVVRATKVKVNVTTQHAYPSGALDAYEQASSVYAKRLRTYRGKLQTLLTTYRRECEAARKAYEADGGEYEEEEAQQAVADYRRWNARANATETTAVRLREPTSIEALTAAASRMADEEEVEVGVAALRAKVVDLASGETFWLVVTESTRSSLGNAVRHALAKLLDQLPQETAPQSGAAP